MKITKQQINEGRKKMSKEELQEHLKHMRTASATFKSKKAYNRKEKYKKAY